MAVDKGIAGKGEFAQFDPGHIFQINQFAGCRVILYDDIFEFRYFAQPSVHQDADLERLGFLLRRNACGTCGHLDVLGIQRIDNIPRHQLIRRHLFRVHPDPHAEIIRKSRDAAHSRDPQQGILDEYIGIIIQEGNVMCSLRRDIPRSSSTDWGLSRVP